MNEKMKLIHIPPQPPCTRAYIVPKPDVQNLVFLDLCNPPDSKRDFRGGAPPAPQGPQLAAKPHLAAGHRGADSKVHVGKPCREMLFSNIHFLKIISLDIEVFT